MKHLRVFSTNIFILTVFILTLLFAAMRPKEVADSSMHIGKTGSLPRGNNSYHGSGHGNHAGHPIFKGDKPSGRWNGYGKYNSSFSNYNTATRANSNVASQYGYPLQSLMSSQLTPANRSGYHPLSRQRNQTGYSFSSQQQQYYTALNSQMRPVFVPGITNEVCPGQVFYPPLPPNQFPHPITLPNHNMFNTLPPPLPHAAIQHGVSQSSLPIQQQVPVAFQNAYSDQLPEQHQKHYPSQCQSHATSNNNSSKPPLFINPAFISTTGRNFQVWKNADGYSEYYAPAAQDGRLIPLGSHSQQIEALPSQGTEKKEAEGSPSVLTKIENLTMTQSEPTNENKYPNESAQRPSDASETLSTLSATTIENLRTPSPRKTSSQTEREEFQTTTQQNYSAKNPTSMASLLNGLHLPIIATDDCSPEVLKSYEHLKRSVGNLVNQFFRDHPDVINVADSSSRIAVSKEDYEDIMKFNNELLFDMQDKIDRESDKMKIEFFVPAKAIFVPRDAVVDFGDTFFSEGSNNTSRMFEKSVSDISSTIKINGGCVSINVSEAEQQQVAELLKTGCRATILMYTEFPEAGNNSNVTSGKDSSPVLPETSSFNELQVDYGVESSSSTAQTSSSISFSSTAIQRSSRFTDFTRNSGNSDRARSTSNLGLSNSLKRFPRWTYPDDISRNYLTRPDSQVIDNSDRQPGPSHRRLPELPTEYRNDRDTTGDNSCAQNAGTTLNHASNPPLRRRHQSQDSTIRMSGPSYQTSWMTEHQRLRFIIPTEREFMARVPFPPYRIPLIGVARRAPGDNYIPQRILPAHENFASFRRRMQEIRNNDDVGDPDNVRGSGPLILEPRGFWYPTDAEMEVLERRHQEEEEGAQTAINEELINIEANERPSNSRNCFDKGT